MPRANPLQAALNAGELSPRLHARVDFAKYPAGAATMANCIPFAQGGWMRRPGTRFIAAARSNAARPRLVPFSFSTTQAYILELGDRALRIYRDQGQIVADDTDAAVSNGTFDSDIAGWTDLSTGSASIAHDAANGRMSLVGAAASTAWAEQAITTSVPNTPHVVTFRAHGAPGDRVLLRIGTTSGGGEVKEDIALDTGFHSKLFTPTASPFTLQFRHGSAKTLQVDTVALLDNAPVEIETPWATADLAGLMFAQTADVMYLAHPDHPVYRLERHDHISWSLEEVLWDDGPWGDENTTSTTLTAAATSGLGVTITASATTGINDDEGFKASDVGRPLRLQHGGNEPGWAVITAVTDTTHVMVDVKRAFNATTASSAWRLGAWSATTGYPAALSFFEQRLALGGTADQPQTFWMSQSADSQNMRPDSFVGGAVALEDDDALDYTMAADQVNAIRWLSAGTRLVIGTAGGEWLAGSDGPVVTPTDITVRRHTAHGSAAVAPVRVGDSVLFLQRAKRKLLEFAFVLEADGFRGADMTRLAEHITRGGIAEIAHQQEPESLVWCVRNDGVLAVMTFKREEDVVGWSRQILGGAFAGGPAVVESVAVIPGHDGPGQVQDSTSRDEVWVAVKRTINGATARTVEMFEGVFEGPLRQDFGSDAAWDAAMVAAQRHAYFADSLLTYDGPAVTSVSGLDHLEGETVKVLADGAIHPDRTVSGGAITLDVSAAKVQVGLGYSHVFRSLKLAHGSAAGTAVGKTKRAHAVTLVLHDAAAGGIGPSLEALQDVTFRDVADPMDTAVPLFCGEHRVRFAGAWGRDPRLVIASDNPAPFTLLALAPELTTHDVT